MPLNFSSISLLLVMIALALMSFLAPKILLPCLILFACLVLANQWHRIQNPLTPLLNHPIKKQMVMFLCFGLITCLWSITPSSSISASSKLFGIFVCFCIIECHVTRMHKHVIQKILYLLPAISAMIIAIAWIELAFTLPLSHQIYAIFQKSKELDLNTLNNGAFILNLLVWPSYVLLKMKTQHCYRLLFWFAGAFTLFLLSSLSAFVGLCVGSCLYGFTCFTSERFLKRLLFLVFPLYSLGLIGFLSLTEYDDYYRAKDHVAVQSAIHRLYIWKHSLNLISEKPVLGWGMNSARHMDKVPSAAAKEQETLPPHPLFKASIPLHPHNGFLQIWLELGIPGVLGYYLLYILIGAAIFKASSNTTYRAAALAALASTFVVQQTAYGIWQQWMWAAIAWQAIIFIAIARTEKSADKTG
jgi:exopolysaccharide production protein ExoQ